MTRVKRGLVSHAKHKKVLTQTKGYRGTKHRLLKVAREAAFHAGQYAYIGRKDRKRDMRRLWITRIGQAAKKEGLTYNKLVAGLKKANITINRKALASLIIDDVISFRKIVDKVKSI
jgi:large subunit ribosomal protein L20